MSAGRFVACVLLLAGVTAAIPTAGYASGVPVKVLEGADSQLLHDFFHAETYGKKIRYRLDARLSLDMDEEWMAETTRKAIEQTLAKTIGVDPDERAAFFVRLKKNGVAELMDAFLNIKGVKELINGTIQFDLFFTPYEDNPGDLAKELSSNRLLRLADAGRLEAELDAVENGTFSAQLQKMRPLIEEAARKNGAANLSGYRYLGGVISWNVRILDTRWRPWKLPRPKSNAVKGYVRYRRIFSRPSLSDSTPSCRTESLRLSNVSLAGDASEVAGHFVTVDAYQTFNLKRMVPRLDRIEIFPGRLVTSHLGDGAGPTVRSGKLVLRGEADSELAPVKFQHEISSLVYTKKKGGIDSGRSDIRSAGEYQWMPPTESGSLDATGPAEEALSALVRDCGDYLVETLNLDRLTNVFGLQGSEKQ